MNSLTLVHGDEDPFIKALIAGNKLRAKEERERIDSLMLLSPPLVDEEDEEEYVIEEGCSYTGREYALDSIGVNR